MNAHTECRTFQQLGMAFGSSPNALFLSRDSLLCKIIRSCGDSSGWNYVTIALCLRASCVSCIVTSRMRQQQYSKPNVTQNLVPIFGGKACTGPRLSRSSVFSCFVRVSCILDWLWRGTEIWRIEKISPVLVPKTEQGKFYSGDSYIVLRVRKDFQSRILTWGFYWITWGLIPSLRRLTRLEPTIRSRCSNITERTISSFSIRDVWVNIVLWTGFATSMQVFRVLRSTGRFSRMHSPRMFTVVI